MTPRPKQPTATGRLEAGDPKPRLLYEEKSKKGDRCNLQELRLSLKSTQLALGLFLAFWLAGRGLVRLEANSVAIAGRPQTARARTEARTEAGSAKLISMTWGHRPENNGAWYRLRILI